MTVFTKKELIERGLAPNAARAKMLIPFQLPMSVGTETFKRLPADLKRQYEPETRGCVHYLISYIQKTEKRT